VTGAARRRVAGFYSAVDTIPLLYRMGPLSRSRVIPILVFRRWDPSTTATRPTSSRMVR
jgi:hypothetical protein